MDAAGVPVRSVHRSRFLLSMSGRYGHALYADRPAARLGDPPRTVGVDATAWEVLDVVADGDRDRTSDDVAVVDRPGGAWASYAWPISYGRWPRAGSRRRRRSIR